jgi:hypothetical protein
LELDELHRQLLDGAGHVLHLAQQLLMLFAPRHCLPLSRLDADDGLLGMILNDFGVAMHTLNAGVV